MTTARITVRLKKGVADPEGTNTRKALNLLGFEKVVDVSTSKQFIIEMEDMPEAEARAVAEKMCEKLLANPVIQTYDIEVP